eukprot:2248196-Heterocapsa_arctica.AAC.1
MPMKLTFQEYNKATIQILQTGKNPTLRHLNRTHRVNVCWLSEVVNDLKDIDLVYCETDKLAADIFTKAFNNPIKWDGALANIGMTVGPFGSSNSKLLVRRSVPAITRALGPRT